MADWPTLSKTDRVELQEVTRAGDPTIRSPFEAGYTNSRSRYTRYPKKWVLNFHDLSTADKDLIIAHEATQGVGGASFAWTEVATGTSRTVRYAQPISYFPVDNTNFTFWNLSIILEEV